MQSASGLAHAIRRGKTTATMALEAAITAASGSTLGAVARMNTTQARAKALAFDALSPDAPAREAPFAGVPILVKDLGGPFAGLPCMAGSRMLAHAGDGEPSDLAQGFEAAGVIPFGLTTTPEFGLSLASEPAIGPVARNPFAPDLSPGGSSGGAAAAVAGGIVTLAHATDAGGSIRVPAACCGLVGLKPGRGSVAGGPGFGNHLAGIASEFALCRTVSEARALWPCLSGAARGPFPPPAFATGWPARLRIGLLTDTGPATPTTPARAGAVEAAARPLETLGHSIVPVAWDDIETIAQASDRAFRQIVTVNLARLVGTLTLDPALAEPLTQAVITEGQAMPATAIWQTLEAMPKISHALWHLFDRFDMLMTPMLTTAPRPLGWLPTTQTDPDRHFAEMAGFAPLASLANVSGFPALSMPFDADNRALPLPVQLIAPMGGEPLLLALAETLQAAAPWHADRHPKGSLHE